MTDLDSPPDVMVRFPDGFRKVPGKWLPDSAMYAGGIGDYVLRPVVPDGWGYELVDSEWVAIPAPRRPARPFFHTSLCNLVSLLAYRQRGVSPDKRLVDLADLSNLIEDWKRLDAEVRALKGTR